MFARKHRIVRASDFAKIASSRQCFFTPFFTLKYIQNGLTMPRYAVVVSNKISKKATDRNTIKRKLREGLKAVHPQLKPGYDIVLYAKHKAHGSKLEQLKEQIQVTLTKANLLKNHD